MRRRVGVFELQAALERPRRVPRLAEVVVGEPEIEVRARVVRLPLQELEAAVTHALREAGFQLAAFAQAERRAAVLAVVVVRGVLDATVGACPRFLSASHDPPCAWSRAAVKRVS